MFATGLAPWVVLATGQEPGIGSVVLQRGSRLRLELTGLDVPCEAIVVDDTLQAIGRFRESDGAHWSSRLNAGRYSVVVQGEGVAAQRIPVHVDGENPSTLRATIERGVVCRLAVTSSRPFERYEPVRCRVRGRGELIVDRLACPDEHGAVRSTLCLAPGEYQVTAEVAGRVGRGRMVVGPEQAADLTIVIGGER